MIAPLAWRNLWRNTRRTAITLVVVAFGLWSVLFFDAFLNAWMQSSKETALGLLTGSGQVHAQGYLDNPGVEALMAPPGVALKTALTTPEISAWAMRLPVPGVVQSEYKSLPVTIIGVDPAAETRLSTIPGKVAAGRYLSGAEDESVILGLHMAERLKTGLGRRVILLSQSADGGLSERSFDVVGLFDADQATEDFHAFTGIVAARRFLGLTDEIGEIVVAVPDEDALGAVMQDFRAAAPDLDVRSWKELNLFLAGSDTFMKSAIYIWLGVVFAVMAVGVANTQLMAVFERVREFGLLRALGMRPSQILTLVVIESVLLIGLGVLLGIALAALTIQALSNGLDLGAYTAALEMFQGGSVLYLKGETHSFLIFSLLIWALGVLVTLWPAWRASRSSPVEAMRRAT